MRDAVQVAPGGWREGFSSRACGERSFHCSPAHGQLRLSPQGCKIIPVCCEDSDQAHSHQQVERAVEGRARGITVWDGLAWESPHSQEPRKAAAPGPEESEEVEEVGGGGVDSP